VLIGSGLDRSSPKHLLRCLAGRRIEKDKRELFNKLEANSRPTKINKLFFFFSSMPKNKRAQFYLMGAVILIGILLGYLEISNSYRINNFENIYFSGDEIEIECSKILEYLAYQSDLTEIQKLDILEQFVELYSKNSYAENSYFVFGTSEEMIISAYRKKSSGTIFIYCDEEVPEEVSIDKGIFTTASCVLVNNINITIDDINNEFEVKEGKNIYFILNEEDSKGGKYIFTGNIIKEE
jgi:hypothetical protein